jgi:hypothetical protein
VWCEIRAGERERREREEIYIGRGERYQGEKREDREDRETVREERGDHQVKSVADQQPTSSA